MTQTDRMTEVLARHQIARPAAVAAAVLAVAAGSGGRVSVKEMIRLMGAGEAENVKTALVGLLLVGVLRARFVPCHAECAAIGDEERSTLEVEDKEAAGAYPAICPHCQQVRAETDDALVIHILFLLPEETSTAPELPNTPPGAHAPAAPGGRGTQ